MGHAMSTFQEFSAAARNRKAVPIFVVSLDALGTLYGFREPIVVQYLKAAHQCGLDTRAIKPEALQKSFRATFKRYSQDFPNYGKGKLNHPEEWWTRLLGETFTDVTKHQASIPSKLAPMLYEQFSSKDAYELYPDSVSFLQTMHALKDQYSDPDGPLLCVGVITNSDPRAESVLKSLGLQVGPSKPVAIPAQILPMGGHKARLLLSKSKYDRGNDIDFLATSYDAGVEKPASGIWAYAEAFTQGIASVRAENSLGIPLHGRSVEQSTDDYKNILIESLRVSDGKVSWIHIGDDMTKDYEGARQYGHHALHLDRGDNKGPARSTRTWSPSEHTVSSLEEAALIVNVMAQDHFKANPAAKVMAS
ncbi:hypothetical protein LTR84_006149 [Exophiala bonariae]|uniref:Uncharacterized protein n=1 Tax=Exophiala bonariae TaxID=1690606 RepID=A0AAV9N1P2_9EURO|nr:hypothetical protein LTR84_006149 [Exophiala bonariae]